MGWAAGRSGPGGGLSDPHTLHSVIALSMSSTSHSATLRDSIFAVTLDTARSRSANIGSRSDVLVSGAVSTRSEVSATISS